MPERYAPPVITPPPATPPVDDEPGLLDYARMLRGRLRLVVAATVGCGLVALAVSLLTPRTYEASVTLGVRLATGDQPSPAGLVSARKLLETRSAAATVVAELGLDREPARVTAERFVTDHLRTEQVAGSNVLRVSVRLRDPDLGARAANRFVEEVVALNRRRNEQDAASAQMIVEAQLQEARARIDRLQAEILSYKRRVQLDLSRQDAERALRQRERAPARGQTGQGLTQLNALYDKEAGLSKLEADYGVALAVYRDLSRQSERLRVQVVSRAVQLDVLDAATRPERPSAPRMTSNVATGAALGLIVATLIVLGTAAFSRKP
jgi:uncharacterized protein involved in exopolysaccharide biosynthesis